MVYEPVIGLELHIQLLTRSKIFCRCSAKFGAEANHQVCPVCLGLPGVLPVLNERVLEFAVRLALATRCKINERSIFARKNYFYPDLPKGYQISQFDHPFCEHGEVEIEIEGEPPRPIRLRRIHLEEDAGKSTHAESFVRADETLIDINRCGVPLLELVTEPDIRSPREAALFASHLRQIVRYLGICDGNMEQGSLRCDANVSLRRSGTSELGVKTELKNMNSFRAVERALEVEIERQKTILSEGGTVSQETLLWDDKTHRVRTMRSKEYSHDYRYFPEPDLVPFHIDPDWLAAVAQSNPEMPWDKKTRFIEDYGLPAYDAQVLTEDLSIADYFEAVAARVSDPREAGHWIMGDVLRTLKEKRCRIEDLKVSAENLACLLKMIEEGALNRNMARKVFAECAESGEAPQQVVEGRGLGQISDEDLIIQTIAEVIKAHPKEVEAFRSGKGKIMGFFIGQVMRRTGGKANPQRVNELLRSYLKRERES